MPLWAHTRPPERPTRAERRQELEELYTELKRAKDAGELLAADLTQASIDHILDHWSEQ